MGVTGLAESPGGRDGPPLEGAKETNNCDQRGVNPNTRYSLEVRKPG